MDNNLVVVILAAGQGKRLGGENQKVVCNLLGKPILSYLLDTVKKLVPSKIIVVVGHRKEEIFAQLQGEKVCYVEQSVPLGTGDAVKQAKTRLENYRGDILVLCGDIPFLTYGTLNKLIVLHRQEQGVCTLLTARVKDPTGYGRIKRNKEGLVVGIVEEINTTNQEKHINEINAGVYIFQGKPLFDSLREVNPDSRKGEYYLTDVIGIFSQEKQKVSAYCTRFPEETMGINTREDLKRAQLFLQNQTVVSRNR